ncbi:hypothetical protein [Arsukibacterium sp.]|uniref:hypothetical protein n=1 Tax=Arsukibacterium sp. TaxID=1977258 RepID=UPI00299F1943|nr:hypothetical protein [Arsukibacterium sp.]MDX1677591.1 hypothetical protein [Arsukibacterium sp.]
MLNISASTKYLLSTAIVVGLAMVLLLPLQAAESLKGEPKGSWIALSGQVVSHTDDSFILDFGDGFVTVNTDNWNTIGGSWAVSDGDKVTVYGLVEEGFYQNKVIDAGSIYVRDASTMVSAPDTDKQAMASTFTYFSVPGDYDLQVAGTVTSVTDRKFTIDSGTRKVTVDTIRLGYNPLDNQGLQQIKVGDFVTVRGELKRSVFDNSAVVAESIVTYN